MTRRLTAVHRVAFCILSALGAISFARPAWAAVGFAKIIETQRLSISHSGPVRCNRVLGEQPQFVTTQTVYTFDDTQVRNEGFTQERSYGNQRAPQITQIVERVLSDWVKDRDHSPDQQELLRARDASLDPRRTIYVHLETDGHPAMLRIFDGSSQVLRGGTEWTEASQSSATTPLEMGAANGYELPERAWARQNPRRPAYIWELGLLNIDRQLKLGVETALAEVARSLDQHYNNGDFIALGKLDSLVQKKMMIYAQTRTHKVGLFAKYGFKAQLVGNSKGEVFPFEVAPNMTLVAMTAEDFIRQHFVGRRFAQTKADSRNGDHYKAEEFQKAHKAGVDYVRRQDAARVPIRDANEMAREFQNVFQFYAKARLIRGERPDRERAAIDFFENYLRLVNSIPMHLRHENWLNVRNLVLELIGKNSPLKSLFYFSMALESAGKWQDRTFTEAAYQKFLFQVPPLLDIMIPTQPIYSLKFSTLNIPEPVFSGSTVRPTWY